MNIFKNYSIKQRFLILFFVCIVTFIGFGIFALIEFNNLVKVTNKLYNQSSKVSDATVNAKVNLVKINSAINDVILASDSNEIQEGINKVSQYENDLQKNLDTIGENSDDSDTKRNLQDANNVLSKWAKPQRDKIIKYVQEGKKQDAINISKGIHSDFVSELELDLDNIYANSLIDQRNLVQQSNALQSSEKITLFLTLAILTSVLLALFILIIKSILVPINSLKDHMINISHSGTFEEYEMDQNDEISEMAKNYNLLIHKLKTKLWINNTQNALKDEMTGSLSVKELTQNIINFLSRHLDAGNGTFYIYKDSDNKLILKSSFAFTERDRLSNVYEVGEGIIGQVALERKPIHLKKVKESEAAVCTSTTFGPPLNVYAFPLIHEDELYGVIELSSFEYFDDLKKNFLEEVCNVIAANLHSALQNERIKQLLEMSEKSEREAHKISRELKNANVELEEKQRQLQIQSEELQQTNSQLEEQQQILQQQSEELQQTNTQLEEHQLQIEEQSRILSMKNEELEKSKEEILMRTKDLENANKYKSQFLANISHELRTPLNSIILLSNLLIRNGKEKFENSTQEKFKVIYNSGQHLLRLINNILDLSKIEAGKIDLNYDYFNTEELIKELKDIFEVTAKEKNIQFILEDQFKNNFYGDRDKISQIVRNFLSNAFKFTDRGTVKLKIVRDNRDENNLIFSVSDTGIGISKEKLDIIFEEFHQGDGSISRKYGGTGLGLSISSRLCELMKGKIKVTSEPEMGSTFYLYLPLTLSEETSTKLEAAVTTSLEDKNKEEIIEEQIKNTKTKKLLIVEDDKQLIQSIKSISEGIGFATLVSDSGAKALKLIEEYKISGILLDLGLPDIDGIDLLKEINELLKLKNTYVPVIIYTGMDISPEQEKEIKLYTDRIIVKTANSDERLLDELTLILHKVNNEEDYRSIMTSKINKNTALNLDNKKILIVDDDPRNIFVLAAALEDFGAEIVEADNGEEALRELESQSADLILMDIMMPIMNGYEAIKKIRSSSKFKNIPIIAITAKSLKGDKEKCIAAGANDYISKPIDYDVLITLIKAWISKD
ncbi:autoinducer 2 sensor kinase/phosphatase LuxQ [Clostridium pasteurianum DSM 525 = ATCC 6013]|uniref:Circadian input-output histidine kinase CikA n=1 Tax=Clostridium pasteurianum DSM 525 = ATCC 6013 TaxID=1262449 RepID=A0A0H3J5K1_CLOPA|nr:response regulator [Clostridium pasteurianum]AJA47178.1 autoinducer 2 sensor kinase/phosphatase LuxQ [Clostridium pasteurianum DSM 525 = ATCC 6013]AJA51166.1 autoinducer 2 sensor kinase/phosphatase LuxQ [Clostridium pasteurianum DSM 525 = ATCC 6013]AOZ74534.1 histidine kinase [Clostridium pasteurianum DSM 525 = ATCC 6013]AOZ78331.1 histidine kinase [Clostridium pasteurianum]ELP59437.1 GAF sensor hybrid histidine kinase [Clostridium pasteurianum DSM 525 = ATCC 6013]